MTRPDTLDLAPALRAVLDFRDARDWGQFHTPKDLAAALSIEAGELQELFLWQPPRPAREMDGDPEHRARVREEIADCAIYLLLLVHELQIDLPRAILEKLRQNETRYPVEVHRGLARKSEHRGPTPDEPG